MAEIIPLSLPLTLFFFFLLLLLLLLFLTLNKKNSKVLNLPPGSYGWPVLGETLELFRAGTEGAPERFVAERVEKHKSQVFKTSLMGEKVVVLCGTGGNKFLFSNENKVVKLWWPVTVRKLLGDCVISKVGEEAKLMRRLLSAYLTPDALSRFYVKPMDLITQQHLNAHWQGKEQVKVFPTIKLYTFELACQLFMSLEDEQHIEKLAALFNVFLKGIISIPFNFPGTRFHAAVGATRSIRRELKEIVRQRRESLVTGQEIKDDLLSHMIKCPDETGKFMPEFEIINNVITLLFAGHDTTSVAITLLMKNLAQNPKVYDNVLREQMEIASSKKQDECLQWEDIQKMKYSWNVVSEVMRLLPPVTGGFREAVMDFKFAGYDIPKGWKLYWSAAYTHRDEDLFPEHTRFDASRFDEEKGHISPFSYLPFGGGPRMCLGKEYARLEILVFLHNVVKRFKWDLVFPEEKIIYDPMPLPLQGLPICLHDS